MKVFIRTFLNVSNVMFVLINHHGRFVYLNELSSEKSTAEKNPQQRRRAHLKEKTLRLKTASLSRDSVPCKIISKNLLTFQQAF